MRRYCVSGLMMLVGLGCGGDGGSDANPAQTIDRIADELLEQREISCECADAPGSFSTVDPEDCEGTPSSSSWSRCVTRALDDLDEDDAARFLSCYLDIERSYTRCISRDQCSLASEDCEDDYDDGAEKCADYLTDDVAVALDDC